MAQEQPGPVALVGSGEYLDVMAPLERSLLAGRPPRYVQLATAAVPDGPDVVAHWHELGRAQAARLGVEAVIVEVNDRADADDPALAAMIAGAGLIYLSGGNPAYLATTLHDSVVARAIEAAWRSGAALAGCSAGAMAMAQRVPDWRSATPRDIAGLGWVPHLQVIPHFDRFRQRWSGLIDDAHRLASPGVTVIGVDEETALVGGPERWTVEGRQSVWRLDGSLTQYHVGDVVDTPLG